MTEFCGLLPFAGVSADKGVHGAAAAEVAETTECLKSRDRMAGERSGQRSFRDQRQND